VNSVTVYILNRDIITILNNMGIGYNLISIDKKAGAGAGGAVLGVRNLDGGHARLSLHYDPHGRKSEYPGHRCDT
jgi:hypothetical protein